MQTAPDWRMTVKDVRGIVEVELQCSTYEREEMSYRMPK